MKWISYCQAYPQRWGFKKDIPAHIRHLAKRVQFRFETVWIVRDIDNRALYPDGNWALTLDFYLKTPGHVIGLRDFTTADGNDWAHEWREAMNTRISEALLNQ